MTIPRKIPQKSYIQGFWSLEETSGARKDRTANNNTLTDNNTVLYAAGKIGNAADFEKDNSEYLSITHANQKGLDITGAISIFCWIKLETKASTLGYNTYIISKYNVASGGRSYGMLLNTSNDTLGVNLSYNGTSAVGATSSLAFTTTGTWYHVGFTLNKTTNKIQIYVNGSANGSAVGFNYNIYNSQSPFAIGAGYSSGSPSGYFDGLIDEAIVWNKCLTTDEISALYNISAYSLSEEFFNFF